jgi:hypothetical protein
MVSQTLPAIPTEGARSVPTDKSGDFLRKTVKNFMELVEADPVPVNILIKIGETLTKVTETNFSSILTF